MPDFEPGQLVDFYRNEQFQEDNIPVIAIVPLMPPIFEDQEEQQYVIENEYGWVPNSQRKALYGLDVNKTYLFVYESELTLAG